MFFNTWNFFLHCLEKIYYVISEANQIFVFTTSLSKLLSLFCSQNLIIYVFLNLEKNQWLDGTQSTNEMLGRNPLLCNQTSSFYIMICLSRSFFECFHQKHQLSTIEEYEPSRPMIVSCLSSLIWLADKCRQHLTFDLFDPQIVVWLFYQIFENSKLMNYELHIVFHQSMLMLNLCVFSWTDNLLLNDQRILCCSEKYDWLQLVSCIS